MIKKEPKGSQSELLFLFKEKYVKILLVFLENKDSSFYVNQLKEKTGLSPRILIQELKSLEKEGILKSEHVANAIFYKLNTESTKLKKIEAMLSWK